jgi:hypothetical protein
MLKRRAPDPTELCASEFKAELRRFRMHSVSTTIGDDRSIFDLFGDNEAIG